MTIRAQPDLVPSRNRVQWEKTKGALPLSLFGEEEKEDESSEPGLLFNGATQLKKTEKKVGSELNMSDLISNLYAGSEPSKVVSGTGLNLDSNGLGLKRSASNLDSNCSGLKLENWDSYGLKSESKGLDLKRSVSNFEINGSSLKLEDWGSYGLNLDSKGSDLKGSVSNLGLNGMDSKINLDSNGFNPVLDEDDDGCEFKAVETKLPNGDFNFKGNNKGTGNSEGAQQAFVFENGAQVPTGLFASSNGMTLKSGELDFGFDFSKSSLTSVGINCLFTNSEQKNDSGVQVPTNLFAASNGISQKTGQFDFGFGFSKSSVAPDGISSSLSKS
ncbi:uncharacterized protein LOC123208274 [Mangifera indica]|uniref:uncharacterized protein LOC123208274 n=1 Tax=Mangifera indica TaxID=29780 RepID=UPI001CFB4B58|nr:uncharacterized protein LOC123208274 [Mangifera indica]XP_044481590.1 uncharacterized protein LOC123208274 [Mangifera indica]